MAHKYHVTVSERADRVRLCGHVKPSILITVIARNYAVRWWGQGQRNKLRLVRALIFEIHPITFELNYQKRENKRVFYIPHASYY